MATATAKSSNRANAAQASEGDRRPIVVSKSAYSGLRLLQKALDSTDSDFVPFPGGNYSKGQIVNELLKKGVLRKQGSHKTAEFAFAVSFEDVVESERAVKRASGGRAAASSGRAASLPVSRGGYLPTFATLRDFCRAVEAESRRLNEQKNGTMKQKIDAIKSKLGKTTSDDEEHMLIQDLAHANNERRNLRHIVTIEAIKNCAAESQFRGYDFDRLVSTDLSDYETEA